MMTIKRGCERGHGQWRWQYQRPGAGWKRRNQHVWHQLHACGHGGEEAQGREDIQGVVAAGIQPAR